MSGYLALVLHAHLPFVRHPEHERFLEELWLFEAITETYLPLLRLFQQWEADQVGGRLAITLTPTLCSMLRDELLQERYERHLNQLIDLAEKELQRTHWERALHPLAEFYHGRLLETRALWRALDRDLVGAFRRFQDSGRLEIITSAATHALLPLLLNHPPSLRAQVAIACDHYRTCFGREPQGIWLPECAFADGVDTLLREANLRWFVLESHGLLNAHPRPRYATFAPVFTPQGLAAFGRDQESARQVWSRNEGYPGDSRYRDFYRDIGFDLDLDYLRPHLPAPDLRGFTGIKYHRITGDGRPLEPYDRQAALEAAAGHAAHFLEARQEQIGKLAAILDRPPVVVSPYDAELFGHWWFEGPDFLDCLVRRANLQNQVKLITPGDYLRLETTNQLATPAASSWGEEGYWRVWLNDANQWIYPHLAMAQERMTELARGYPSPTPLHARVLRQAGRELLLAQASDWAFIIRTGTSPDYARKRILDHLSRFAQLYEQLSPGGGVNEAALGELEAKDNLFPDLDYRHWAG